MKINKSNVTISAATNKPSVALLADKIASELGELLDMMSYVENLDDYLAKDELGILVDALDILMFFDKVYTTDWRKNKGMI